MDSKETKPTSPFVWKVFIPVMAFAFLFGGLAMLIDTGTRLTNSADQTVDTAVALASSLPDASFPDLPVTNNCCYTHGYDPDCNNIEGGWDRGWYDCEKGGCEACRKGNNPPPGNGGGGGEKDPDKKPSDPKCVVNGICGPGESHKNCPQDCDELGNDIGGSDPSDGNDNNGGSNGGSSAQVCRRGNRTFKPGQTIPLAPQGCFERTCTFGNPAENGSCPCYINYGQRLPNCETTEDIRAQQRNQELEEKFTDAEQRRQEEERERQERESRANNILSAFPSIDLPREEAYTLEMFSGDINNILGIDLTPTSLDPEVRRTSMANTLYCRNSGGTPTFNEQGLYVSCNRPEATSSNTTANSQTPPTTSVACEQADGAWIVNPILKDGGYCTFSSFNTGSNNQTPTTAYQCIAANGRWAPDAEGVFSCYL